MDVNLFWNGTIEDLKNGYAFKKQEKTYVCLLCGEVFEQGVIYPMDDALLDAAKAIQTHIKTQHPPVFEFYLGLGRIYTGLSAGQEELSKLFYAGHSDKEIVGLTGANSTSTIRNQRFAIREKYKQAKILVASVELMEENMEKLKQDRKLAPSSEKLVDFHPTATMVDERFAITQAEKNEVLNRYFDADGKLVIKNFPTKEKRKIIILQRIMGNFEPGRHYSEGEVNKILKEYYADFVTVRRYLIQYGFLDRDKWGKNYWRK